MPPFTGGRQLAKINRQNTELGSLLSRLIDSHNRVAAQAGVAPVGQNPAPPSPNAISVDVSGEMAHVRLTDNSPTNRNRRYWVEVHGNSSFTDPLIIHPVSASRSPAPITLPTNDGDGMMKAYFMRAYSQDPGSPPSPFITYPTYVTMNGSTDGNIPPATGSGTSTATQSGQGFGTSPTRPATGPKRRV